MKLYLAGGLTGNLSPYYQALVNKQAEKKMRVFLAGNGYHKTEEFLQQAEEKMRVFLAGNGNQKTEKFDISRLAKEVTTFEDFNILESYYMLRESENFMELLTRCNTYLIDSGAFTFMQGTHKEDINWDEYIEQYADFINRWDVKLFFELDIETLVGMTEVERLRAKLEKLTNKQVIPVWHVQRGKDYFLKMCEEYNYVALGGLTGKHINVRIPEEYFPWFINTAHQHNAKIHGLGYTSVAGLHKYHFDSVDSTAWLSGNMGGYIYKFIPEGGKMKQLRPKNAGRLKAREAALNNFIEWVKFCKYADKYL